MVSVRVTAPVGMPCWGPRQSRMLLTSPPLNTGRISGMWSPSAGLLCWAVFCSCSNNSRGSIPSCDTPTLPSFFIIIRVRGQHPHRVRDPHPHVRVCSYSLLHSELPPTITAWPRHNLRYYTYNPSPHWPRHLPRYYSASILQLSNPRSQGLPSCLHRHLGNKSFGSRSV